MWEEEPMLMYRVLLVGVKDMVCISTAMSVGAGDVVAM